MKQLLKNTVFYRIYLSRKINRFRSEEIEKNHAVRGPLMYANEENLQWFIKKKL